MNGSVKVIEIAVYPHYKWISAAFRDISQEKAVHKGTVVNGFI